MVKQIIFMMTFIGFYSVVSEGFACPLCFLFGGSKTTTETTLSIEGMTCNECVSKVESALNETQGVKKVAVSLKNKLATVKYDKEKVTVEELIKSVEKAGFKTKLAFTNIILDIEGMTCNECVSKVESALNETQGVKKVAVSLKNKQAMVDYDKEKVSVEELIKSVDKAGFNAESAIPNIVLNIEGMTCGRCQEKVQSALNEISGVKKAEVSLKTNNAIVEYEKGKVSVSQLIGAVNKAGFQAESEK